jgi:hypothetical protein
MLNLLNTRPVSPVSFRHRFRVIAVQLAAIIGLAGGAAGASSQALQLNVSNETVPPGGTVELKFSLSQPNSIAIGELAINLDPTVFASVTAASVFSANGDAAGVVQIQGLHVDVHFSSQNGGIGLLAGVPVVVVTATVLPTATVGKTASVTADPAGSQWLGPSTPTGNGDSVYSPSYSVSVTPGTVTVGGTLSVSSVTPVGGVLPAGTVIQIQGTGFTSATTAQINGVNVALAQVTGSQTISLTLGGPAELTGKQISVRNSDGSEVDVFPFGAEAPVSLPDTPLDGVLPIMPLQTYTAAAAYGSTNWALIRNPNASAVQLAVDGISITGSTGGEQSFTVPASTSLLLPLLDIRVGHELIIATAPVQIVTIGFNAGIGIQPPYPVSASAVTEASVSPLQASAVTPDSLSSLSWVWQTGTAAPQAQTIRLPIISQPITNYTISVATSSGGPWLSVTPPGPIQCQSSSTCATLQVSVSPQGLAPGNYRGTVTITPVATIFHPVVEPVVIPVALTVTTTPLGQTLITPRFLNPNNLSSGIFPPAGFFGGPVSMHVTTDNGSNWLTASVDGTTTAFGIIPNAVTVTANTARFAVGSYSGAVVVSDSTNTLVIPVQFIVEGADRLTAGDPTAVNQAAAGSLESLNVVVHVGDGPPPAQVVPVGNEDCEPQECFDVFPDLSSLAASVQTHSGGNWLGASVANGNVIVTTNPTGLSAGVYLGAITLTANGLASGQFPVVLVVEDGSPPTLVAGPGVIAVSAQYNPFLPNSVCVTSASVPLNFSVQASTSEGGGWLTVANNGGTTPACITYQTNSGLLTTAGHYTGSITITSGSQSVTVPVTLDVVAKQALPLLGAITNSASQAVGVLYPGEAIAIYGLNLEGTTSAPPSPNGVSVLIGGISAPIVDASPTLIHATVPAGAAGRHDVTVQVQNDGGSTATWDVPLMACASAAAPASFQIGGAGGLVTIQIQAAPSCPWTVANLPIWASISGAGSGYGPASVSVNVSANNGPARSTMILVGGFAVQLNQDAASACTYTLNLNGQVFSAAGGTGIVTITAEPNCQWTVGVPPPWVTLLNPTSGSGNGSVRFQVSANSGIALAGSFTIGGQTFTVQQQSASIAGLSFVGSLAHFAALENWTTMFTLVNKSGESALARLTLFGDTSLQQVAIPGPISLPLMLPQSPVAGVIQAESVDQTISPNASFLVDTASGYESNPVLVGSAQLAASGAVDGFAIFHQIQTTQEAVVPLETRNAGSYLLPFDNTDGVVLGVAVANVVWPAPGGAVSAEDRIGVVIRDDSGTVIETTTLVIIPGDHRSFVLPTQYPVTANIRGTIEFDTPMGGQISVLGLRFTPPNNALTTIPALANVGTTGGSIAHLASGGDGWQTTFVLVNTGSSAAQTTLSFFNDVTGATLSLPLAFPQAGDGTIMEVPAYSTQLAAGATLVVVSGGGPQLLTGSAQLSTTGNVSGFVIFRHNDQEAVVPLESRNAQGYIIAFDNTNGTATGIAVNSVSSQQANVPVIVRDDTGAQIATDTITLAANGHYAFTLGTDRYPATANIRGTIEFDAPAGAQIGALGIRMPSGASHTYTTLPALAK